MGVGSKNLVLLMPVFFTMASFALVFRHKSYRSDKVLVHVLSVAIIMHLAQFLRFAVRGISWFEETVPFTAALMGLAYMLWLFLPKQKVSRKLQSTETHGAIFNCIDSHLRRSEAFRDPGLTLAGLAKELGLPAYLVSQAINQQVGRFSEYVNELRIQAFLNNYKPKKNVEAIAHQVGFKSRSAFYRAFKAATGKTPSQYIAS